MIIPFNHNLDIMPQIALHIQLRRADGTDDNALLTDLLETIDHLEINLDPDEPSYDTDAAYEDGYGDAKMEFYEDHYIQDPLDLDTRTGDKLANAINAFRSAISQTQNHGMLSHCTGGLRRAAALHSLVTADSIATLNAALADVSKAFVGPGHFGYSSPAAKAFVALLDATSTDKAKHLAYKTRRAPILEML